MKVHKQAELKNGQIVTIRPADKGDVESLVIFGIETFKNDRFFLFSGTEISVFMNPEAQEQRLGLLAENGGLRLIAVDKESIIADVNIQGYPQMRRKHVRRIGMSVLPPYQGLGAGTAMLEWTIQWAEENEVEKLELGVYASNPKAINLYRKMGFVVEGTEKKACKFEDGHYEDCIMMARWIDC